MFDGAFELEAHDGGVDGGGGQVGAGDELVDVDGFVVELGEDGLFGLGEGQGSGVKEGGFVFVLGVGGGLLSVFVEDLAYLAEAFEDVFDAFDEFGAFLDEQVGAGAARRVDAAGDGHDVAVLFDGESGGDECSTAWTGFDDDGAE